MAYTRVLGTIGLIGATVLGAVGPMQAPSTVLANAVGHRLTVTTPRLSSAAARASALLALRRGYFTTRSGHRIYLSSGLLNAFSGRGAGATASGAVSAAHAAVSPGPQPTGGAVRANQDFGFYQTGNGQLFHNTESVAVDPQSATHVVISATDTRLGSDGSILNISSNPITQGTHAGAGSSVFSAWVVAQTIPTPCSLIEALGGPGVYDSVDGARTFSDLIIPDMLSGAVPDAIDTAVPTGAYPTTPPSGAVGTPDAGSTAVGCIPPSGSFTALGVVASQLPRDCLPYDSDGDQAVSFDPSGNLYDVSLGLVSDNPLANGDYTDAPQTDIVLNVSPAIQPACLGASPAASCTP